MMLSRTLPYEAFKAGLLSLVVVLAIWAGGARAEEPAYLKEMPTPAQVIAKTKGSDELDTQARRAATFARLIQIMHEMQGRREFHGQTPGEIALEKDYAANVNRIQQDVIASLPPKERTGTDSKRAKWFSKSYHYEFDDGFQKKLMGTYFTPAFSEAYGYAHIEAVGAAARGRSDIMGMNARQAEFEAQFAMFVERQPKEIRFLFHKETWIFLFSAWFLFAMGRELFPLGLDGKNPRLLRVGGRSYEMNSMAGDITDVERWTTTQVQRTTTTTTDGWGNTHTTHGFVTYYTHHVRLSVQDGDGKVHTMEFTNQNINLWKGLAIVCWWGIPKGKAWGEYLYFEPFSGKQIQYVAAFAEMMRVRLWATIPMIGFMLVTNFSFWTIVGAYVGFLVLRYPVRIARELWFKTMIRPRLDIQRRAEAIMHPDVAA